MSSSKSTAATGLGKSLLNEYRDELLRKKDGAQDASTREQTQELIDLVEDLNVLFEHG